MPTRVLTEKAVLKHPSSPTAYIFALICLQLPKPYQGTRLQTPIFVYSASDGTVNLVSVSNPNPKANGKQVLSHSSASGPIRTGTSALIPIKVREKGSTGTYASCNSGFATGGRDGKVQVWAVEGSAGVPEGGYQVGFAGECATPNGQAVSALAANHERSLLVAGTELEGDGPGDVAVHIWSYTDLSKPQLLHSYTDSHTDTITFLHFHVPAPAPNPDLNNDPTPAQRQLQLLSCSTDGLINIYDPSIADEDEAVLVVFNNKAAVSHVSSVLAYSSPAAPSVPAICAISHDEKFGVFEIEDKSLGETGGGGDGGEEEATESTEWPVLDLRQALQADYAIGLRPRGLTEAEYGCLGNGMVLATGTNKEETLANIPGQNTPFVDLFLVAPVRAGAAGAAGAAAAGFESAVRLQGAHGEEIVRDVWFEETAPFVLTCGEDGCVRLWSDEKVAVERGGGDVEMAGVGDEGAGEEKASRTERRQKRKEKRHKPY